MLTLSGNNTFDSGANVLAGTLSLMSTAAVGTNALPFPPVKVSSGAALQVQDGINAKITLTLNGAGVSGGGALLNYAGNTTLAGRVILGSSATIDSNGGTLTLASPVPINAPAYDLTAEGPGNIIIQTPLQNLAGLIKDGPGMLTLTASQSYTGPTSVNDGTLVAANGASGSATGAGTVTLDGGTLASAAGGGSIRGGVVIGPEASVIAPGGIGGVAPLSIGSLVTASNLTTLNFDLTTPGSSGNLLTILGGLTLAPDTAITFGADPTAIGDYRLIGGSFGAPTLSDFNLPAAPGGETYSLSTSVNRDSRPRGGLRPPSRRGPRAGKHGTAGRRLWGVGALVAAASLEVGCSQGTVPIFAARTALLNKRAFSPRKWDCPPCAGAGRPRLVTPSTPNLLGGNIAMLLAEPPRTRGDLNFALFGFPVRIHPLFWLVALILGPKTGELRENAVWVAAMLISILVHELGHALVMRAYGLQPSITLHIMGGLTSANRGQAFAPRLRPLDQVAILAGRARGRLPPGRRHLRRHRAERSSRPVSGRAAIRRGGDAGRDHRLGAVDLLHPENPPYQRALGPVQPAAHLSAGRRADRPGTVHDGRKPPGAAAVADAFAAGGRRAGRPERGQIARLLSGTLLRLPGLSKLRHAASL